MKIGTTASLKLAIWDRPPGVDNLGGKVGNPRAYVWSFIKIMVEPSRPVWREGNLPVEPA